jgi:hypothetical protein
MPIALLLIAHFRLPYGFYTIVRIVVSAEAAFIAWCLFRHESSLQIGTALFSLIAVTLNPIMPVRFPRAYWAVIDPAVAAIYFVCAILVWRAGRTSRALSGKAGALPARQIGPQP